MNPWTLRYKSLAGLALLLFVAGCASPSQPTRFYRLDSQASLGSLPMPATGKEPLPLLGVGPVSLASYLDRPQMIERGEGHRLVLHEFDQWAGTLQENIVEVLSREMQQSLPKVRVIGYPWNSGISPGHELVIDVSRFERQADKVVLEARWSLFAQPGYRLVMLDQSSIETPVAGSGMESVVTASGQAVRQLAAQIVSQVGLLLNEQSH